MILVTYIFQDLPVFRLVAAGDVAKEIKNARTMMELPEYRDVHVYELEELPL